MVTIDYEGMKLRLEVDGGIIGTCPVCRRRGLVTYCRIAEGADAGRIMTRTVHKKTESRGGGGWWIDPRDNCTRTL